MGTPCVTGCRGFVFYSYGAADIVLIPVRHDKGGYNVLKRQELPSDG